MLEFQKWILKIDAIFIGESDNEVRGSNGESVLIYRWTWISSRWGQGPLREK